MSNTISTRGLLLTAFVESLVSLKPFELRETQPKIDYKVPAEADAVIDRLYYFSSSINA
jgi:hypothetical protein